MGNFIIFEWLIMIKYHIISKSTQINYELEYNLAILSLRIENANYENVHRT